MHPPQMACSVVAFVVPLSSLTCLTIGQEGLVRRGIDRHPYLSSLPVYAVGVSTKLMLTAEPLGIVIASGTFQAKHFPWLDLSWRLKCRRRRRSINLRGVHNGLLSWRGLHWIRRLGPRRDARERFFGCSSL